MSHHAGVLRIGLVGFAGALGALARYGIGSAIGVGTFPWSTLLINVAGSALLGYVLHDPTRWSTNVTTAIATGFLGAFTTFSTFSFEATALVRSGRASTAALYVVASVAFGLLAASAGYLVAREIA